MAKVLIAKNMNKCLGCFSCMQVCALVNKRSHSFEKSCIRVRTTGGITDRFIAVVCQACTEPPCAEVCPSHALTARPGGGVKQDTQKCIGCRRCEDVCLARAIGYDTATKKPLICNHCGVCAQFCPHDCLIMQEVPG